MLSTSNSTIQKFRASKFAPLTPILSLQKLSLLHYLGYRRFPLQQECIIRWCRSGSEWRVNAISSKALSKLTALLHWLLLLLLHGLARVGASLVIRGRLHECQWVYNFLLLRIQQDLAYLEVKTRKPSWLKGKRATAVRVWRPLAKKSTANLQLMVNSNRGRITYGLRIARYFRM